MLTTSCSGTSSTRERVRQIEVRAFEKLQKAMKAQIAERRLNAGNRQNALAGEHV